MTAFFNSVDIGNRALQHVGAKRISAFTDNSKNAASVAFVYDKARRAELRRNVWRFAIKRATIRPIDTTTFLVAFNPWSATISYQPGAIVADPSGNGVLWTSTIPFNLNRQPGQDASWDVYFGPATAAPYDTSGGTSYDMGEMVYLNPNQGAINVYSSVSNANTANPGTVASWASTTTYAKGQIVQYTDGFYYESLIDLNLNNTPNTNAMFNLNTTYASAAIVAGTDGKLYISVVNSNLGHDPATDHGTHWQATGALNFWTPAFTGAVTNPQWVYQYATVQSLGIIYPLGAGPVSDSQSLNVYRLPNGFLRQAPQDPKQGAYSYLGAPTGPTATDWNFEGNYITSRRSTPITLRFVADITLVPNMDDMFCEGLGARIALEICEELTQSADKLRTIGQEYAKFMTEARTVNGIETGPVEANTDEWIAVRR